MTSEHPVFIVQSMTPLLLCSAAEPVEGQADTFEWGPVGIRPFDATDPQAGGDVATVKTGHVSVTPLRTGYAIP